MTTIVIALGSNLGDRLANLRTAVAAMQAGGIAITARSSVWETPPVPADQPEYLNAVVAGETAEEPLPLLARLKAIEHEMGRRPGRRWGPRPIDLDILFYGDVRFESPALSVPHPRLAGRSFVLAPLAEVLPGELPVIGGTAAALLETVGLEGARVVGPL